MKSLYRSCLLGLFSLVCNGIGAQTFYQYDTTIKVFAHSQQMTLGWCGGFNNPQFSNADLNHDGLQDLVAYEPGLGVTTFINRGMVGGVPNYRFEPKYALTF